MLAKFWWHHLVVKFLPNTSGTTYNWPNLEPMQVAFFLAGEITQIKESIPWVRCASGNVLFIWGGMWVDQLMTIASDQYHTVLMYPTWSSYCWFSLSRLCSCTLPTCMRWAGDGNHQDHSKRYSHRWSWWSDTAYWTLMDINTQWSRCLWMW